MKEEIHKAVVAKYLIRKIGIDYYCFGNPISIGLNDWIIIPKNIYYKEKFLEQIRNIDIKSPVKLNIDNFGYSDNEEFDNKIQQQIKDVTLITNFQQKIDSINLKYYLIKEKRKLSKQKYFNKIDKKLKNQNFLIAIISIIIGILINKISELEELSIITIIVIFYLFIDKLTLDILSKRYYNLYGQTDEIILAEEEEDLNNLNSFHILRISWKNSFSTTHLVLDKKSYKNWIDYMKKRNLNVH